MVGSLVYNKYQATAYVWLKLLSTPSSWVYVFTFICIYIKTYCKKKLLKGMYQLCSNCWIVVFGSDLLSWKMVTLGCKTIMSAHLLLSNAFLYVLQASARNNLYARKASTFDLYQSKAASCVTLQYGISNPQMIQLCLQSCVSSNRPYT